MNVALRPRSEPAPLLARGPRGRIGEEVVAAIRAGTSIEEVIGEHGVSLRKYGSQRVALCPFHSEQTASFVVHPLKQVYHCHGCQAGGDVVDFVQRIRGCGFRAALQFLAVRIGVDIDAASLTPEVSARVERIRAERERRQSFEKFCADRQAEVADRYYTLSRLAIKAEHAIKDGCSEAVGECAWTALKDFIDYDLMVERDRPTDRDVLEREWSESSLHVA